MITQNFEIRKGFYGNGRFFVSNFIQSHYHGIVNCPRIIKGGPQNRLNLSDSFLSNFEVLPIGAIWTLYPYDGSLHMCEAYCGDLGSEYFS